MKEEVVGSSVVEENGVAAMNWREGAERRAKLPGDHETGSNLNGDLKQQISLALTTRENWGKTPPLESHRLDLKIIRRCGPAKTHVLSNGQSSQGKLTQRGGCCHPSSCWGHVSPKMLGFLQKLLLIYVCKLLEATDIKQCMLFSSISQ